MTRQSEILMLIPARAGSKRLPGKNMRRLGGRTLLAWTAEAAEACGLVDEIILSTDSEAIAAEGAQLGLSIPFLRPEALASDTSTSDEVALHLLDWLAAERGWRPEYLILLQPTSPFRAPSLIAEGYRRLRAAPVAEALISVVQAHVPPSKLYVPDGDRLTSIDRCGRHARCYLPTGALFIARTEPLRQNRTFMPPDLLMIEHSGASTLDIDTPADWAVAEAIVSAGLETS